MKGAVYKSFVRPAILYGSEQDENFMKGREIYGENNVCSAAERYISYGLDATVWFELNNISVGYSKQCVLVWSCVEEGGLSCLYNSIAV